MNGELHLHDMIALLEDAPVKRFETGRPLCLHRSQIGTVVMTHTDGTCDVEFADRDGRAYAILPIQPDKLMVLHDAPDYAAA
jgi:hypothetical protein